MTRFASLCSLTIAHGYYGGLCPDLAFVIPRDTAQVLANGRMVAKPRDGQLVVLYEADDAGAPVVRAEGRTLRIGLALRNPHFLNFTAAAALSAGVALRFTNEADPRQLAGAAAQAPEVELLHHGVLGVAEVCIDASFYAAAADLTVVFAAKQETLKYYLVARNFSNAEVGQLDVADAGFTEEGRPQVAFTKVAAAAFTPAELPAAALGGAGATVLLFKSLALVPRRAAGRKKIQLRRNNEILVKHLPAPNPESATADVIVHVSKT